MLDGVGSSAASLLGAPNRVNVLIGRPLLLLLVVAAVGRIRSTKPLPHSFWSALAILLSFWFLTSLNGRAPSPSRYQYVGGVLLLMVLADAAAGIRLRRQVVLVALGIGSLAVIANLVALHHYYARMSDWATRARGALAAFQVGGASADPNFTADPSNTDIATLNSAPDWPLPVGRRCLRLAHIRRCGLAGASEEARVAADQLLADAEELRPVAVDRPPAPAGPPPRFAGGASGLAAPQGSCLTVPGGASPPVDLPRPGVTISPPGDSAETVGLRRFASSFPVSFPLGGTEVLLIRSDRSPRPWQAQFRGPGPVRVCGLSGGPP